MGLGRDTAVSVVVCLGMVEGLRSASSNRPALFFPEENLEATAQKALDYLRLGLLSAEAFLPGAMEPVLVSPAWWRRCTTFDPFAGTASWNGVEYVGIRVRITEDGLNVFAQQDGAASPPKPAEDQNPADAPGKLSQDELNELLRLAVLHYRDATGQLMTQAQTNAFCTGKGASWREAQRARDALPDDLRNIRGRQSRKSLR